MSLQRTAGALLLLSMTSLAQNYKAEQVVDHGVSIVRLSDAAHGVEVSVAPGIGNRAYEMKVHGKNILYFPFADAGEFQKRPIMCGIPFLAPWADLLNEPDFWANGKKYLFNMELGNVRGNMPIHGLLVTSPLWRVTEVTADGRSARVSSRLEFWKYPDLMAQWPFAHEYEMTYSLADGALEVKTTISNQAPRRCRWPSDITRSFKFRTSRAMSGWRAFPPACMSSPASIIFRQAKCGRWISRIHCRCADAR